MPLKNESAEFIPGATKKEQARFDEAAALSASRAWPLTFDLHRGPHVSHCKYEYKMKSQKNSRFFLHTIKMKSGAINIIAAMVMLSVQ